MTSYIELDYSTDLWRGLLILAKKVNKRNRLPGFDYEQKFGSRNRLAASYCRRLAALMGVKIPPETFQEGSLLVCISNPRTGEIRGFSYTPCGYHDASAGVYIES